MIGSTFHNKDDDFAVIFSTTTYPSTTVVMTQQVNAFPVLNAKDDKHNIFNDGKKQTIRYVEWKDEMETKARWQN